jgi:predicted HTH transcriptional regulator
MNYVYLAILSLIAVILFLKYRKSVLNLKQENKTLKSQIENQKCNNFNSIAAENNIKQQEIESRKFKITEFLTKHETITNDQVESLFKVSNSTAYRLLENLEKEGRILQIGNTGKDVYYILNRYKK